MAADYFLKLDGINGESRDARHEKWIELQSWSWGEANAGGGTSAGGGAGKVSYQDMSFTARLNAASPLLMLACATGQHIQKATLSCRKAGGKEVEYLQINLTDCLVSSYEPGGTANGSPKVDDRPVESLSLNFTKIEMVYASPFTGVIVDEIVDFSQLGSPPGTP
jgi:type VI secretion system secreted protein Hcp